MRVCDRRTALALLIALISTWGVAQESAEVAAAYETRFEMAVGGVLVDVDGSEAKFRTDRNLRSGFDTRSLFYDLRPTKDTKSPFDTLVFSVSGIGDSNPYQRGDFRIAKKNLYELKGKYQRFNLFFGLPDFALGFHPEDSVGRSGDLALELFPGRKVSLSAGYRRNQLYGTRFSSQNLTFDTYPLSYPRRMASDEVNGGIKWATRALTLNLVQSFIRYRDDAQVFPNGDASLGLLGNRLVDGQRDAPTRISNPITRVVARYRPSRRYEATGRYFYSGANLDLSRWETLLQRTGQGQFPVQQILSSAGTSEKPSHNLGAGQSFDITDRLTFHHRVDFDSFSITGLIDTTGILRLLSLDSNNSLEFPFQEMGGTVTDFQLFRNDAELEYAASDTISLVGGHRYSNRHVGFGRQGSDPRPIVTIGNTGVAGMIWKAGDRARVRAEVEKGVASEAFNRRDPLDTLRLKVRAQLKASRRLTLTGSALFEDNANDSPGVNYDLDNRQVGVQAVYVPSAKLIVSGGYNAMRIRTTTDIVFWTLSQLSGGRSVYDMNTHAVNALVQIPIRDRVELRAGYDAYKDFGETFPLRMHVPRVGAICKIQNGFSIEAEWRYFNYDERRFALQDYRANSVYMGLRYSR